MKYRDLPGTGLHVSQLCLGTMTFGDQLSPADAVAAAGYAFERGINFFDTADIYYRGSAGTSEAILGKAVKPFRDRVILATKCGGPMTADINGQGLSRCHVIRAVEESLMRLDTDYIDILYYHFPDPAVSAEDMLLTANMLIQSGKIRYYGVSNFSAWQTLKLYLRAKEMGLVPPAVTESVYNLLTRGVEEEMLPMLAHHPIGLVVFNPLAGGLLTGKHKKNAPSPNSRFSREKGYVSRYFSDSNLDAGERLNEIAAAAGYNMIEMALKWLLASKAVTSVIVGFSRLEQLQQNLDLVERENAQPLPMAQIDAVWTALMGSRFSYHQ